MLSIKFMHMKSGKDHMHRLREGGREGRLSSVMYAPSFGEGHEFIVNKFTNIVLLHNPVHDNSQLIIGY